MFGGFSVLKNPPLWNRQLFAANVLKLKQTTPAIRSLTQTESVSVTEDQECMRSKAASATSGNTSEIGKTVVKVELGVA